MNSFEKELLLCVCRLRKPDGERLETLLQKGAMSAAVLGELFWNRTAGVAYHVLRECGLLPYLHREARNALSHAWEQNVRYNESYFQCLKQLQTALAPCAGLFAVLKGGGGYLCAKYPDGCRTSNDADLLTLPESLTALGKALADAGFRQGSVQNGVFVPASREEIVRSRMTRGETVPYLKEVDLPYLRYFEVDVNFSPDFKNGGTKTVRELLTRAVSVPFRDIRVPALAGEDFFLHLCAHLYKEATTYPWISGKRDMTLYKYVDLYLMLFDMTEEEAVRIPERARALNLETECTFAVSETKALFGDETGTGIKILERLTDVCANSLLTVISPEEKKKYRYTEPDTAARFFATDRTALLEEVGAWRP